jgi:hypothetical protein
MRLGSVLLAFTASMEFLFIRNPDLLGNGRLPFVVQDFKYNEAPL